MAKETSIKLFEERKNPETFPKHKDVARRGSNIAKEACLKLEAETGKKVVSKQNVKNIRSISKNSGKNNEQ